MPAQYALKVQAIRSKKQKPRLYVYLPAALVEAINLIPGEEVHWELLDRRELHLVRERAPATAAKKRVLS